MLLVIDEVDWRVSPHDTMYKYFFDNLNANTNTESSSTTITNAQDKRRRIHDVNPFDFVDDVHDDSDEL